MLSYMIPVEEKSAGKTHLQLDLELQRQIQQQQTSPRNGSVNGLHACEVRDTMGPCGTVLPGFIAMEQQAAVNGKRPVKTHGKMAPTISTDSSVSSLSSSASQGGATPTSVDKLKPKLVQNGATKTTSLKRVSFGSSKGSMVETLIYESPLQEEPETATPTTEAPTPFQTEADGSESKNPSTKVRVTFFESERPHVVPGDVIIDILDAPTMTSSSPTSSQPPQYNRQASTDSGWDNPFRPDGDLSREADEIVERIREGKPITPTPGNGTILAHDQADTPLTSSVATKSATSPSKGFNGNANCTPGKPGSPGAVDVQRTVVSPTNGEPEHVVIKKKAKCKCCVIQ